MKIFRLISLIFIGVLLVLAAALVFWVKNDLTRPNEQAGIYQIVQVSKGESTRTIAAQLKDKNIISSELVFLIGIRVSHKTLNYGYYKIPPHASMVDVINMISNNQTVVYKITIPEGWRAEQIAQLLDAKKIVDYQTFLAKAKPEEGKLFPDTYYFAPNTSADKVVLDMENDYSQRIKDLNVTSTDLIVASIVEREAANDNDRALIAGIYENRINAGMKLQSDPTVEYARDTINVAQLKTSDALSYAFWKPAKTVEFTSVISPYNTYQTALPPGPICNPGLKSIEAALDPVKSNYFYFLYGSDGLIHPSETAAGHQAAIIQYMN